MTEAQRAAMQAAHDALAIAQNNLAASRATAIAFDDGDLWDQYQSAMDGITSALVEPDTAVTAEREACKAIAVSEQKTMCEIALSHPDGSASRDRLFARARSAESIAQAIGARGAA